MVSPPRTICWVVSRMAPEENSMNMADRARLRALICRKMLATMATSSTQKPTNSMPPMKERSRLVVRA
ncbi:hypothetical protein D3C80_1435830 [compost metagenome]